MFRLLIIEEDEGIAQLEGSLCGAHGCTAELADTASEGLILLAKRAYDAILIGLPLRLGREELLRALEDGPIRQLARRTIVLTTQVDDSEMTARLSDAGVYAVVAKPFDLQTLAQLISSCVRNDGSAGPTRWAGLRQTLSELCAINCCSADDGRGR